jgi:hypothetical protein
MIETSPTPQQANPRPKLVVGASMVLVAVVLLSWYVGHQGTEEGFSWELASIFGTALGTTLLAVATGALALLTSRDVSATQDLAAQGRRDQIERERPVVIAFTAAFNGTYDSGHLSVDLRNVGLGPAVNVRVLATYDDPEQQPRIDPWVVPAITPGATSQFAMYVQFEAQPPGGVKPDLFTLRGTYLDRSRAPESEQPIITGWETGPRYDGTSL